MKKNKVIEILPYLLVVLAVTVRILSYYRILPLPVNFAPITAIALFGGIYLGRKYVILIPLAAMAISDYFIGFYQLGVLLAVWGSFVAVGLIGFYIRKRKNVANVIYATLGSSILFFVVTNFAVWAAAQWYPKTLAGLTQCYFMAIPFFRNTLLGDIFFVAVFFGTYELVKYLVKRPVVQKEIA